MSKTLAQWTRAVIESLKCTLFNYLLRLCFLYDTILAFKIKHIYIEQDENIEKEEFFEKKRQTHRHFVEYCRMKSISRFTIV